MKRDSTILVLTGAGISAESGIRTFRDSGGLWEQHRVEDVATPDAFQRDPELVWRFFIQRLAQAEYSLPNAGHRALAVLEQEWGDRFALITQNVDGLHQRAGSQRVYEMHGTLHYSRCTGCTGRYPTRDLDLGVPVPKCPACGASMRPDIVWFGEIPYFLEEIDALLRKCDIFLVVGTSGVVYPAAGFVMGAKINGAKTIAVNLENPQNKAYIDEFHQGRSAEVLPSLVDCWIKNQ